MKTKIACLVLIGALPLFSQFTYFYGKNKVIRSAFNWKFVETPHFRVYNYVSDQKLVQTVAEEAERAYVRISNFLGATIQGKTPLIFYNRQTDIEQTNLIPMIIPPGSFEGFTEPIGQRVVIYGNRPSEELSTLIIHELTHSFENEILYKNRSRSMMAISQPPLWIMEGLADFMTGKWDSFYLMTAIDYVVNDRIPEVTENGDIQGTFMTGRTPYDIGHLMFDFIFEKFGKKGVQKILDAQKRPSFISRGKSFLDLFNYTPKTFSYEFKKYARQRFHNYFAKENPEDYSFMIGPDFPFAYAFSHQVSPSGEMLAVLTANFRNYKIDLVLLSLKDGKVIKNITPGVRTIYDGIWFNFNPIDGRSFCWDRQARQLAFFARKELDYYLLLLDVASGMIEKRIRIKDIEKPSSPLIHPQGKKLYFTGVEDIHSYIYIIDMETQKVQKLTGGKMYIRSFDISPDGKKIAYTGRQGEFEKLYLAPLENPEMGIQLTSGAYNDINPSFANDGNTIYYSSDERGTYNINAVDVQGHWVYNYTDVRTGNFFPVPIPKQENQLVISSFHKGGFYLFRKDVTQFLTKRQAQFREPGQYEIPVTQVQAGTSAFKIAEAESEFRLSSGKPGQPAFNLTQKQYRPLEKIVVNALPTVMAGIGTGGEGFYGSGTLILSDLMNDYNLGVSVYSIYGYRSYIGFFMNQKHRLQYFAQFFYYALPYNYYDPYVSYYDRSYYMTVRSWTGAAAGFYYPFNRSYRAEISLSMFRIKELAELSYLPDQKLQAEYYRVWGVPLSFSLVGETTRFAEYGPNMGHTFKLTATKYFKLLSNESLSTMVLEGDVRKYFRIDNNTLLALRLWGYYSGGATSLPMWTGGYNTIRSTYYGYLIGTRGFTFNAEFRFPIIHAALTPIGVIGPIRGVFFFDVGSLWFKNEKFRLFEPGSFPTFDDRIYSSYGFGLHAFIFGLPVHFDWVYNTHLNVFNDNKRFFRVSFWIGYDF